jgi:hypothetical protein
MAWTARTMIPLQWLMPVLLSAMLGCGDQSAATYPVTGKVNYQGKPLPLGTVMFISNAGKASAAEIGADGTYRLEAIPGKHQVSITAMPKQEGKPNPNVDGGIDLTGVPPAKSLIPAKYNEYRTSGIEVEVKADGENQIDIDLK